MPALVHAVIVARPDARANGLAHFEKTLAAVAAQRFPVEAVTIVLCGRDRRFADVVNRSGAEGVIQAESRTGFAQAVALASHRVSTESSLWLLAQDTVPEDTALERLMGVLETNPSVAVVAPKLVRSDAADVIASLGVSMSRGGETVELAAGQFDQGQHDGRQDVLGSDVRGVLLRAERRGDLLPDVALGGADEGLDMGVRARLGGHRVSLAPTARIVVSADGVAGLPDPVRSADRRRITYSSRLAQLHRRLTYAPGVLVPLHILSFLPIALWRAIGHLIAKLPGQVLPEWAATFVAAFRWPAIARSRKRLSGMRGEWWRVDSLRVTGAERREILESDSGPTAIVRPDLRFFSGGGAWTVLASLVVAVVAFPSLLGWRTVSGGALLPQREDLAALWGDTLFGNRAYGVDVTGPADPFAAVMAVLGSITPAQPSTSLVILWILALPLATLGGWFAMTRITERAGLRITGAVLVTFAPALITALTDPRPAAVLAFLALPWLFYTGAVVHRSWGAAGAASLLFIVVSACSPSLGVVIAAIVVVGVVFALVWRRFSAAVRLLWTVIPAAVFFLPLAWRRISDGDLLAFLADPGLPYTGERASDDLLGRLWLLAGFPAGDGAGWASMLAGLGVSSSTATAIAPWLPLGVFVVAVPAVLAVTALFVRRWRVGAPLVLIAVVAFAASIVVSRISVSVQDGASIAVWPGALTGLGWIALSMAAVLALDAVRTRKAVVGIVATLAAGVVLLAAVPGLTLMARGESALYTGRTSTLPAFVGATAADASAGATLVLTVTDDGSIAQRVVWGSSDTLSAQTTLVTTGTTLTAGEESLAAEIADLVSPQSSGSADLASHGIAFVLVTPATRATGTAAATRSQAVAALTQNDAFQAIGETGKGALWRVLDDPAPRSQMSAGLQSIGGMLTLAGLIVLAMAVLLAIPTRSSVRAARAKARMIGAREDRA